MKKSKVAVLVTVVTLVILLLGAALVIVFQNDLFDREAQTVETKSYDEAGTRTFADWTDMELFQNIPAMVVKGTKIGTPVDYGSNVYILDVNGTGLSDYRTYLTTLENSGFAKYCDNGEDGIDGAVYTASFTKDDLELTVTHVEKWEKTYIAACKNLPLSEHLVYKEEYAANLISGAKTKVHMVEMYDFGNSFIIQLKNGHFIVNDGGAEKDAPYLFDYLESLAPKGEKPFVEAWIISHAHADHMGALASAMGTPEYADRVYVEGFYFCRPNDETAGKFSTTNVYTTRQMDMINKIYKTSEGETPKVYRLQTGQKYYFCDIVMEVTFTQEQLLYENHYRDFNDTSTWLMYYIEGQKFALCGDADVGASRAVMSMYDSTHFDMDVFTAFHHGINVWDPFTDFCTFKTVLYPNYRTGSLHPDSAELGMPEENAHLRSLAEESLAYGHGTQILTFPYKVGTAVQLPESDWRYDSGKRKFTLGREDY